MSNAFVSFYEKNGVSPVAQDISNLKMHYNRRKNLLSTLGVTPIFLEGKSILEFGPGSGHNSIFLASLKPKRFELVEGNSKGINDTKVMLEPFVDINIKLHYSFFEDFKITKKFDLVWAEGCVPHQTEPLLIAKHISSYTKQGGVVVFSFNTGISYLSEIMRRIFTYQCFKNKNYSFTEKLNLIKPFISNHLKNLKSMSRYYDDWIIDSLLQPLNLTKLFTIPDAIHLLKDTHNILLTSPKFVQDWRWYKDMIHDDPKTNEMTLNSYYKSNLNLLDFRFCDYTHSYEFGVKLENIGLKCWKLMCQIENGDEAMLPVFNNTIKDLIKIVKPYSQETVKSLLGSMDLINKPNLNSINDSFAQWWGRGQQYASFICK